MMSPRVHSPVRSITKGLSSQGLNSPRSYTPGRSRLGPPCRIPRSGTEAPVRVVVRVRPFLESELSAAAISCAEILKGYDGEDTLQIFDKNTGRTESYKLGACYGDKDSNFNIFAVEVEPLLSTIFQGYNATVFAYGATGSGKTHTMQGTETQPGLMSMALKNILAVTEHTSSKVTVSYYEVYMDRCYDLLEPKVAEVLVLEDSSGRVQLRGLVEVVVNNMEEFRAVYEEGCVRRKIGHTGLNDVSSRSHAVLSVAVTCDDESNPSLQLTGKLNLIDLAGNENNRRTGNDGMRLAESTAINQSLFALSNVINALHANELRVPYRDNKLTRILQDSLGGHSRAVMVACLNPASYQEASATLSLAARSRQIVNRVGAYEDPAIVEGGKVDMETKLKQWRESKGKTPAKSAIPGSSPLTTKTPTPLVRGRSPILKRILVTEPIRTTPIMRHSVMEDAPRTLSMHKQTIGEKGIQENVSGTPELDNNEALAVIKHVGEDSDANRTIHESIAPCPSIEKENVQYGPLMPYESLVSRAGSPPLSARLKSLGSTLRALSPLPSNVVAPLPELAASPVKCTPGKSPEVGVSPRGMANSFGAVQTPPQQTTDNAFQTPGMSTLHTVSLFGSAYDSLTPFDQFNKKNTDLQGTLVKQYLHVLNTATREELLQLKGIGPKRAESLMKLRETSPEPLKERERLRIMFKATEKMWSKDLTPCQGSDCLET